jgi:hypothetical protein
MKRRLFVALLSLLFSLSILSPALAQGNYYFAVERETVQVFWNADGTMSLDYTWVFANQPGSHDIDYVDVGMPNNDFSMSTVTADVNGTPVSVSTGDYQGSGSGFAVVLGNSTIGAGQRGTVHVYVGRIDGMMFPDTDDDAYASVEFAPTYFGSQYVTGSTDLTVTFHLPPGVQPEEPKWHSAPGGFPTEPLTGFDDQSRITYTWSSTDANAHSSYTFGASFPRTYVPADAINTPPVLPSVSGDTIFTLMCFGFFGCIFFGIPILTAVSASRRKLQYLPPRVSIEGHGIKRGLTAVEAAVLMEQPLDKVMTMILFAVVKKGAAEVTTRDPLELSLAQEAPADLHQYEKDFLKAFAESDAAKRRRALQDMTVTLVRSVSDKLKGFSRKESIDYYKAIMEKAWQQVEAAATPEVKGQLLDQNLEWTMLDKDYDDRSRRTFTGPIFVPTWWHHYDPVYRRTISTPTASRPVSSGGNRALPGADFAASVVGGVQNFSSKVIGNVNTFTEKITGVTNPPPKPSTTSYRSGGGGGGHSCACACACAGCACACAGGGR